MKKLLAVLALAVCMSFPALADPYPVVERSSAVVTLEAEESTLKLSEVKESATWKYFVAYVGGNGRYYISRFKSEPVFSYSGGTCYYSGDHASVGFVTMNQLFEHMRTAASEEAGSGGVDFRVSSVLLCNFNLTTEAGEVVVKRSEWVEGSRVEAEESTDPGETDPEPGESGSETAGWFKKVLTAITSLPEKLLEGLKGLFIPSEEYMQAYKERLSAKFSFVSEVQQLGETFKKVASDPEGVPVLYVDLPEKYGGRLKVLDFTPVDQHMPKVRKVLSAFVWLFFAWRLFGRLPDVLGGAGMVTEQIEVTEQKKAYSDRFGFK